jgi:hypothetical protein
MSEIKVLRVHCEELHNSYVSPNIIRQIKSRRMRWAEQMAQMEKKWERFSLKARKKGTTRKTEE